MARLFALLIGASLLAIALGQLPPVTPPISYPLPSQRSNFLTTTSGAPVDVANNSQTLGPRGPILLQDSYLIERLQIHNRERIPERNVHARGATAKGRFFVTNDVSQFTFADVFQPGRVTPLACRWSTVIHASGSPEYLRDPRGFALKFYTQQGNYDIVGLNFPVFFIRDGIRFPEMIRSLKPNPITGVQEWWRIWDFFAGYPESVHMWSWLLDDGGIPLSYRHQDGWGIHTYKWIARSGQERLVRYYWKSQQGVQSFLSDEEAAKQHFSFHTADLFNSIQNGTFPRWTLFAQLIDPANVDKLPFDPLDTTRQWPGDPTSPSTTLDADKEYMRFIQTVQIGFFEFTENVRSQFLENELIAFSPSRFVPGIEPSDERMLQTRMFAYPDTQRYRIGVNNQMLPINRPRCPMMDRHIDGFMNFRDIETGASNGEVNYWPSFGSQIPMPANPYPHENQVYNNAAKVRTAASEGNLPSFTVDDFHQAGLRFQSFPADRRTRFVNRVAAALSGPRISDALLDRWLTIWGMVNADLGAAIRQALPGFGRAVPSHHSQTHSFDLQHNRVPHHPNTKQPMYTPEQKAEFVRFKDAFLRASGSAL